MDPIKSSIILNYIADAIDSSDAPSRRVVASDLETLVSYIESGDESGFEHIAIDWKKLNPIEFVKRKLEERGQKATLDEIKKILKDKDIKEFEFDADAQKRNIDAYKKNQKQIEILKKVDKDLRAGKPLSKVITDDDDGAIRDAMVMMFEAEGGDLPTGVPDDYKPLFQLKMRSDGVSPREQFKRLTFRIEDSLDRGSHVRGVPSLDPSEKQENFARAIKNAVARQIARLNAAKEQSKERLEESYGEFVSDRDARKSLETDVATELRQLLSILSDPAVMNQIINSDSGHPLNKDEFKSLYRVMGIPDDDGHLPLKGSKLLDKLSEKFSDVSEITSAVDDIKAEIAKAKFYSEAPAKLALYLGSLAVDPEFRAMINKDKIPTVGKDSDLGALLSKLIGDRRKYEINKALTADLRRMFGHSTKLLSAVGRIDMLYDAYAASDERKREEDRRQGLKKDLRNGKMKGFNNTIKNVAKELEKSFGRTTLLPDRDLPPDLKLVLEQDRIDLSKIEDVELLALNTHKSMSDEKNLLDEYLKFLKTGELSEARATKESEYEDSNPAASTSLVGLLEHIGNTIESQPEWDGTIELDDPRMVSAASAIGGIEGNSITIDTEVRDYIVNDWFPWYQSTGYKISEDLAKSIEKLRSFNAPAAFEPTMIPDPPTD